MHFAFGAGALLVGPLGRAWCVAVAGAALLYNALVAPALGWDSGYRRGGEGRWSGLTTYPLAVLVLVLVAPPAVAAGAWVVLAAADPVAAAVGSRFPRPRVPGNPRKSVAGSLAGFATASVLCAGVLATMDVAAPAAPAAAGAAAGVIVEALPLPIDDNLPLAAASAAVLWLCLG